MPHATATKGAWIRPHARPAPPPKPVDPIASNISLLQYLAGTAPGRHRSTSPTKSPTPKQGTAKQTQTPATKVKLPKGLGLEGLEGLQYRPPPPRVDVVEVVDEERTEYSGEEGDGGEDVVVVEKKTPRRVGEGSRGERGTRYYSDGNASVQQRSYYRPPPPPPSLPKPKHTTTIARTEARRTAAGAGPIPHVSMTRHVVSDPVGAASARAALERGIRERKLERFGREERGWGEGREGRQVGYAHRVEERSVARMGSGSRAMREAITPLVM